MSCKAKLDISVCEGATIRKPFIWQMGDPLTGVNLTNYVIRMQVRSDIPSPDVIFDFSTLSGEITIGDQTTDPGLFILNLEPEVTQGLCKGRKEARVFSYDLLLIDGTVFRPLLYGKFILEPAVTRNWED